VQVSAPCENAGDDDPEFGSGSCSDIITLTNVYVTFFTVRLLSDVLFCNQQKYTLTGRTSGAEVTYDWPAWQAIHNIGTCLDVCDQNADRCQHLLPDGGRAQMNQLEGTANVWNVSLQRHQIFFTSYAKSPLGFQVFENVDVTLKTFSVPIIQIIQRTSTSVWIEQATPGDTVAGWHVGADIRVAGTVNYDGTYGIIAIQNVSPGIDRLGISKTYVADEFTGTIEPSYDGT